MAFVTPLPLTRSTRASPPSKRATHHTYRRRTTPPKATIAMPTTPSDPADRTDPAADPTAAPWMPLPGVVHEIRTPEQYDRLSEVAKNDGKLLVIDFMASWCRKCLYLLPKLTKIATAYPGSYYCTVDVNKVRRLPKEFAITKMPTFVFVRDQHIVSTIIGGAAPAKVAQQLENAVAKFVNV